MSPRQGPKAYRSASLLFAMLYATPCSPPSPCWPSTSAGSWVASSSSKRSLPTRVSVGCWCFPSSSAIFRLCRPPSWWWPPFTPSPIWLPTSSMPGSIQRSAMAELSLEAAAPAPPRRPLPAQLKAGLLSLLAPWIAPHPWDTISIRTRFQPPSLTYWFSTDDYGRDVLSRLLMGGRLSLAMGVGATLISVLFGVPVGLIAGYFGGKVDETLMRIADVLMAIPAIMLGLLVLAVTPPALWKTAVAVGFVYVPLIARVARSVTLGLAKVEFVEAARARAESAAHILFREILPNAWPPLIVEASLRVTYAILLGSAL